LTPAEMNYSTSEKECLAVIYGVKRYRSYLVGSYFEVITDHSALRQLLVDKSPKGRLARWVVQLQEHNFKVKHRPGIHHV